MITRFNNVKMSTDSPKANQYSVVVDTSKGEKEFNIPKNYQSFSVLMVGNKDHEEE